MAGSEIIVRPEGMERLQARLSRLAGGLAHHRPLLDALAAEGESQTRRRIAEEKTSPDGERWPAWSPGYAATRESQHSLLIQEGNLLDSINAFVESEIAGWGTNLVYAATHQFGDPRRNIQARPFLGLSDENLEDLLAIADDYVDGLLS